MKPDMRASTENKDTDRLSPLEAAKWLGYKTAKTLHDLRREGKGPAYIKYSERKIMYEFADLKKWQETRRFIPAESRAERTARLRLIQAGEMQP